MFSYTTEVNINLETLKQVVSELEVEFKKINTKETHEGRSAFSKWNNTKKCLERLLTGEIPSTPNGENHVIVKMTGKSEGASARVYFKPSFTSLPMDFRRCVEPVKPGNVFAYFDIRAAEFIMNCFFAQEMNAIIAYQKDQDVYLAYKHLFPEGTPRKCIKEALIANMYGMTAYTLAKRLNENGIDCSEAQADRLLEIVRANLPRQQALKNRILGIGYKTNAYHCPSGGFNQKELVEISKSGPKGFNPNLALSCYTQSALGLWMQGLTTRLQPLIKGTLISVFDSVFAEISPSNLDRYTEWVKKTIAPFKYDKIKVGNTLYSAQND